MESTVTLTLPDGLKVDLGEWLARLGDGDYQRASSAHVGLAQRAEGGMLSIERFPLALIINRHVTREASEDRVVIESPRSVIYVLAALRVGLHVRWTMELAARGESQALTGHLQVRLRRPRLDRLIRLLGVERIVEAHAREELAGFVADIARKHDAARVPPPTPSAH